MFICFELENPGFPRISMLSEIVLAFLTDIKEAGISENVETT